MNENLDFADRLRRLLDRSSEDVAPKVADRLFAARQLALVRQRAAVAGLRLAGADGFAQEVFHIQLRPMLTAMALAAGVSLAYCWNLYDEAVDNAEVDSQLLADEVPFNAYIDQGFQEWLKHRAEEPDSESSPQ